MPPLMKGSTEPLSPQRAHVRNGAKSRAMVGSREGTHAARLGTWHTKVPRKWDLMTLTVGEHLTLPAPELTMNSGQGKNPRETCGTPARGSGNLEEGHVIQVGREPTLQLSDFLAFCLNA